MPTPKILAFAGSARADSLNKKLAARAAALAQDAGAQVTLIDLRDFPMSIYDGDTESSDGLPEHALRFKALLKQHHGLLIACPEYNGAITPLLKNTIDWASRPGEGEGRLECFQGKVAALVSASPGAWGGMRGIPGVRTILSGIGTTVIADSVSIPKAHEAFDSGGGLLDDALASRLSAVVERLIAVAGAAGVTTA